MKWAEYWKNMNFELDKIKKCHRMFLFSVGQDRWSIRKCALIFCDLALSDFLINIYRKTASRKIQKLDLEFKNSILIWFLQCGKWRTFTLDFLTIFLWNQFTVWKNDTERNHFLWNQLLLNNFFRKNIDLTEKM